MGPAQKCAWPTDWLFPDLPDLPVPPSSRTFHPGRVIETRHYVEETARRLANTMSNRRPLRWRSPSASTSLDAFCLTTGYSRKYAISMLRGRRRKPGLLRKPRRKRYGRRFQAAPGVIWEAAGYICAERLRPFLPDLLQLLERHGHLSPRPGTRALLLAASTSTIARNLAQLRQQQRWRGIRPGREEGQAVAGVPVAEGGRLRGHPVGGVA